MDSNIIFSAILNVNSRIGQVLLNGNDFYDFYVPNYLRNEIWDHREKIKKIGRLNDDQFLEVYELVLKSVRLLSHSIVPKINYEQAFIAFSLFLKCKIWTGDKKLINGLSEKDLKRL